MREIYIHAYNILYIIYVRARACVGGEGGAGPGRTLKVVRGWLRALRRTKFLSYYSRNILYLYARERKREKRGDDGGGARGLKNTAATVTTTAARRRQRRRRRRR